MNKNKKNTTNLKKAFSQILDKNKNKKSKENLNNRVINERKEKIKKHNELKIKRNLSKPKIVKKIKKNNNLQNEIDKLLKECDSMNETYRKTKNKTDLEKLKEIKRKLKILYEEVENQIKNNTQIDFKKTGNFKKINKIKKKKKIEIKLINEKKLKKKSNENLHLDFRNIELVSKEIQKNTLTNKSSRLINSTICTNKFKEFVKDTNNKWGEMANYIEETRNKFQGSSDINLDFFFKEFHTKIEENKRNLNINIISKNNSKLSSKEIYNLKDSKKINFIKEEIDNILTEKSCDEKFINENEINKIFNNEKNKIENLNLISSESDTSLIFQNVESISEFLLNRLIEDIFNDNIYNPNYILKFSNNNQIVDDISDGETIYGIRTNLNAVNEYCNLLLKFLLDNNIPEITKTINSFNYYKPIESEFKNFLENKNENLLSEIDDKNEDKCYKYKENKNCFLKNDYYLKLEEEILSNYQNMNIMDDLFNMQRVYHRCIFDAFNYILKELIFNNILNKNIYFRIHNPKFKIQIKKLDEQSIINHLYLSKSTLIEISSFLCGIMKDKEDSIMGNVKFMEDNLINQLREERLFRLLTQDIEDREIEWKSYENDIININIEISNYIYEYLIDDLIKEFL